MKGIFLDIETTGLDALEHCPIDIAFKVIELATGKVLATYQSLIKPSADDWAKRDPTSLEINGYKLKQLADGQDPQAVAREIIDILSNLDIVRGKAFFICQNPAFDRGFFIRLIPVYTQEKMNWPYHWLDLASMYWAIIVQKSIQNGNIIPDKIVPSKNNIAEQYHLPPELPPHHAIGGVNHLIRCYQAVLNLNWQEDASA